MPGQGQLRQQKPLQEAVVRMVQLLGMGQPCCSLQAESCSQELTVVVQRRRSSHRQGARQWQRCRT